MTFSNRTKISNQTEVSHFHFDRKFDNFSMKWDWKREFMKTERQVSVGKDRRLKEDQLWRWPAFSGKFPPGPKRSVPVST